MSRTKEYVFDAYCKAVMRNAATNAHKQRRRRASKAILFSDLAKGELERLQTTDSYEVDKHIFTAYGREVEITDTDLFAALCETKRDQRDILLLSACFELSDADISALLSIPRSTVQYRRTAAAEYIRKYLRDLYEKNRQGD